MKKHREGAEQQFLRITENMTDEQRDAVLDCLIKMQKLIILSRALADEKVFRKRTGADIGSIYKRRTIDNACKVRS